MRRFEAGGHTLNPAGPDPSAPPAVPITNGPTQAPRASTPAVETPEPGVPPVAPTPSAPQYPAHLGGYPGDEGGRPADPYGREPAYPAADATQVNPVAPTQQGGAVPPGPDQFDPYYDEPYDDGNKRIWLWVLATVGLLAVLVALIVILANAFDGGGDSNPGDPDEPEVTLVRVPVLIQLDRQDAIAALTAAGLDVGQITTEENPDFPVDLVIDQDPEAGEEIEQGMRVNLTVVVGPEAVAVPSIVGLTRAEALLALSGAGFEAVTVEEVEDDEIELGLVVEQIPSAGTEVDLSADIIVRVSTGPGAEVVPNLESQVEADAVRILEDLGWNVEIDRIEDPDIEEGFVVGTDPGAGTELEIGEIVTLRISDGPGVVRVPNVIGETPEDAAATLAADGLGTVPDTCLIDDPDTQEPGTVIDQTPGGGIEIEVGNDVVICVGEEPEPTPIPEPTPTPTPEPTAVPTATPEPTPTPTPTLPPVSDDGGA